MAQTQTAPGLDLLDDLCTRFIMNVPPSELETFEKLMFLVEQAHWFYQDNCRESDTALKSLSLKEFTGLLFGHCPGLAPFRHMLDDIYSNFNKYKQTVPTMGAIILDPSMEKVLLVRGIAAHHGWGFPKGKIAMGEADHDCAIRETMEETGFDISSRISKEDFIEVHVGIDGLKQQRSRLFIIQGVEESTCFMPTCKGEIGAFAWHLVDELPSTNLATRQIFTNDSGTRHRFFMVYPFVRQLRLWIKKNKRRGEKAPRAPRQRSRRPGTPQPPGGGGAPPAVAQGAVQPMTTHVVAQPVPGQSWTQFRFKQDEIVKHLLVG